MPKFIKNQFDKISPVEWIGIGTALLAAVAVYWAAITDWFSTPWVWWTIPGLAVVVASGVLVADRISAINARAPFKPLDPDSLRGMIEQWLIDYGFKTTRYPVSDDFDTNQSMLDDIRIEIAHFEVSYSGIAHPLRQISLSDQLLYDETFTNVRFMEKFTHVAAAFNVIDAIIRRSALRFLMEKSVSEQPPPRKSDDGHEQSPK